MIAKNFSKYPEALRFQRELFSNGYHNSPRIMRLVECIFNWTPTTPAWWTEAKNRARSLAKSVKLAIADFFKDKEKTKPAIETKAMRAARFSTNSDNPGEIITALIGDVVKATGKWAYKKPCLDSYIGSKTGQWHLNYSGVYRRLCPKLYQAISTETYQYASADGCHGTH